MSYSTENTSIALPITNTDRQLASKFANQQVTPEKQQQVYRNILAVLTTHHYLAMLGVDSDLQNNYCWSPITRFSADVADLYVPEAKGHLECRAIETGESICRVPEEVWENRIGYVVVQLDKECTEGNILGFVPAVMVERLPLSYLRPLDDLIDRIGELSLIPAVLQPLTQLAEWFQGVVDTEKWLLPNELPKGSVDFANASDPETEISKDLQQKIKQVYISQPNRDLLEPSLADTDPKAALVQIIQTSQDEETRFKAAELLWQVDPYDPTGGVRQVMDLGLYLSGHSTGLMVAILPRTESSVAVHLRVYAAVPQRFLPMGLVLTGFDENGETFFEVRARKQDDYVQFKFTADYGDRFSIKIAVDDSSVTESFVV